jgi:large subunit ribosomal protein L24
MLITGAEKGKSGEVLKVFPKLNRLIVKGVNLVTRHKKAAGSEGGAIKKEATIHISNVAFFDQDSGKASKIGFTFAEDGKKLRVTKKTKKILP